MKMASRDIANMHVFLEMKKKFPHLPEETLRNFVYLYANDQDKCVNLLEKKSKNFHSTPSFSDYRLLENKFTPKKSDNPKTKLESSVVDTSFLKKRNDAITSTDEPYPKIDIKSSTGRSTSHARLNHLESPSSNPNVPLQSPAKSAPVLTSGDLPFVEMCKHVPVSSQAQLRPSSQNYLNRMMFSTTKEHTILPSDSCPSSSDPSERHAVSLNITPSFPFQQQQQQLNACNSSVCAPSTQSSQSGRHTTSVNFQLRPGCSTQPPMEISSVPTQIGTPSDFQDFGSHVQISVGSQGATFTALRLHRPQGQTSNQLGYSFSSQSQNSKVFKFQQQSPSFSKGIQTTNQVTDSLPREVLDGGCQSKVPVERRLQSGRLVTDKVNVQTSFGHGFQASPDYIQAVKKHQLAQLELLQEELDKEKSSCSKLKSVVNGLEKKLTLKREKEFFFSYAELVNKLKDENRNLRVEVNCLFMEYDVASKGQIPVGVTDEDFYSNIFTGPNHGFTLCSNGQLDSSEDREKRLTPSQEEEEDERNKWRCKKCTFANHPALEKCEMCELSRNSGYVHCNSRYSSTPQVHVFSTSEAEQRRPVGSVQISVTRRVPNASKSIQLHLTHRRPR